MRVGDTVKVMDAFENEQLKRVVAWDDRNIYVCREDEFTLAKSEDREPISIGFPRPFVLGLSK
jgi:hypothetical protein